MLKINESIFINACADGFRMVFVVHRINRPRSASIFRIYFIRGKNTHCLLLLLLLSRFFFFLHSHKIFDELFSFSVWTRKLIDSFFSEKEEKEVENWTHNWLFKLKYSTFRDVFNESNSAVIMLKHSLFSSSKCGFFYNLLIFN